MKGGVREQERRMVYGGGSKSVIVPDDSPSNVDNREKPQNLVTEFGGEGEVYQGERRCLCGKEQSDEMQ